MHSAAGTGSSSQRALANLVATQLVWFACVLGGDAGGLVALLHVWAYRQWISHDRDGPVILGIATIGFTVDLALAATGVIHYAPHTLTGLLPAPLWLAALWLSFATLFCHGLQWLQSHLWLAAGLGAVAGPLTYYAGVQLGAAVPGTTLPAFLLWYALLWTAMTPLFAAIARACASHNPARRLPAQEC